MSAEALPAVSRRPVLETSWFRLVVRLGLALLALWVLHVARSRYVAFENDYASTFQMDFGLWLLWVGSAAAAGLLFGPAAWFPFKAVRYL